MFKKFVFSLFLVGMLVGPLTTNASTFTSLKAQLEYLSNKIANFSAELKGEVLGVTSSSFPVVTFAVTPNEVEYGDSMVISWSVVNATSCKAAGENPQWIGDKNPVSGSETISNITKFEYFSLHCSNGTFHGSGTAYVQVKSQKPTVTIKANPDTVFSGGSSTISWEVSSPAGFKTNYCYPIGYPLNDWRIPNTKNPNGGSQVISNITVDTNFGMYCVGTGGFSILVGAFVKVKPVVGPQCYYPVPPKDCSYIKGPEYNPVTNCGMILDCKLGGSDDGSKLISIDTSSAKTITTNTTNNFCSFTFAKNLAYGNVDTKTSKDVSYLQSVLVDEKLLPSSSVTGNFYAQTRTALANFQKRYKLAQTGKVDANTRIKLNSLFQDYCNNI